MKSLYLSLFFLLLFYACNDESRCLRKKDPSVYCVNKTEDFKVTGKGDNENWKRAELIVLRKREKFKEIPLQTVVKILYSETGIYFLFHCEDNQITSTLKADFEDLWTEDVVEVFLWPDQRNSVYFEYEISPLNFELPIIVANIEGTLFRWRPFHYEENRHTKHKIKTISDSSIIEGWIAEFFIPYTLLVPLINTPPKKGDSWRANFYRIDYDFQESISWLWQLTENNFHEYNAFGTIIFD